MGMVSIITVNYNQAELTCLLLESIRQQEYRNIEVIVVDNASTDDPTPIFQARYPEVKFLRSDKNRGFAGGNNLALPMASGAFLFFVNNDAEIAEGCIAQLVKFLKETPNAGIVSPLILTGGEKAETADCAIQYAGMPRVNRFTSRSNMDGNGEKNTGQYTRPFATGYAHGAAMMVPRRVLEAVSPMSEDYFLYYEEVDWCERMYQAGYSIWVEPRAVLFHKESMTMADLGAAKTYYLTRNRILFMRRHYGGWAFGLFLLFLIFVTMPKHLLSYLLKGDWDNIRAFLKGIWAGLF